MARMRWDFLVELINREQLKLGYEIGVSSGLTMSRVLAKCPGIVWHGVDPWVVCDFYDVRPNGRKWDHEGNYKTCKGIQSKHPDRCFLHRMGSVEAAQEVEDGSLDIVFIDGLHDYDGVKADIEAWFPKVRKGGYVVGHDYKTQMEVNKGVTVAVDEIFGAENVNEDADLIWWVQKD